MVAGRAVVANGTTSLLPSGNGDRLTMILVSLLSITAEVRSNCPQVLQLLRTLYPATSLRLSPSAMAPTSCFLAREHYPVGSEPSYQVSAPDGVTRQFDAVGDAVAHLEHLINAAAVVSLGSHLFVHAGAVASLDRGIVLPGTAGLGKSTLVAALSLAGFTYYSDELAVLACDAPTLRPFLKAICLKDGGWKMITAFGRAPSSLLDACRAAGESVHYLLPSRLSAPEDTVPIRYVLLPERRAGARAELALVSRARALAELAGNSLNLPRHGQKGIETLARTVEGAQCYALTYDDLPRTVAAISALVGHGR